MSIERKSIIATKPLEKFYKYMRINEFLYETLINSTLWFSSYLNFNDPFETYKPVLPAKDVEIIKEFLRASVEGEKKTTEEVEKWIEAKALEWKENRDQVETEILLGIGMQLQTLGICCFSQIKDNILMWSHYGDGHRGICLEFDLQNDLLFAENDNQLFATPYQVNYPEDNVFQNLFDTEIFIRDSLIGYLLRKSYQWGYEKELRYFDKLGSKKFVPERLTGIYFGASTNAKQINTISNILKICYPHANIYQFGIDKYEFKIKERLLYSSPLSAKE